MKKLLIMLALVLGVSANAQTKSYTLKYNTSIKTTKNPKAKFKAKDIDLYVIFSGDDKGDVILFFNEYKIERYKKSNHIQEGVNKEGKPFRWIATVREDGVPALLQLFDNNVLRIHYQGYTIEYGLE
jgi:hypothetical protein